MTAILVTYICNPTNHTLNEYDHHQAKLNLLATALREANPAILAVALTESRPDLLKVNFCSHICQKYPSTSKNIQKPIFEPVDTVKTS